MRRGDARQRRQGKPPPRVSSNPWSAIIVILVIISVVFLLLTPTTAWRVFPSSSSAALAPRPFWCIGSSASSPLASSPLSRPRPRRRPGLPPPLFATTSSSPLVTVEGEVPVLLLRADIAGLSREEAVAWVHAWCTQSLAVAPSSASSSSSSSSASSSTSTTTRPFGGQSTSATAYDARVQARPGLPVGITSLPIKPTLTDKGARVVCQGLGPAFLDVEVVDTLGSSSAHTTLIVRQCMGERQMQQHSTSIRGLARDTEKAVLDKLQGDLPRTLGGETDVTFYTGAEAALHQASTTIASPAPPTGVTDVDDEYLVLQDKGAAKAADKEEEDARLRELVESLGLADALNLDEMDGDEWAADPNSPFAKKAVEAYEAFVQKQQETGGGGGDGGVAEAVAGMGDVMLEELQAASATPEDVRAMFESGLRSAEQEHTRVAEKGKKRKRILAAVKEVGAAKAEEEKATGVKGGLVTLQMMFEGTGLKGGVDILAGPPGEESVDLSARMARGTDAGVLEEEEEEEEEIDGEEEEEVEDEDEWDEALGRMGEADPLGDVGWDVAERFDVLVRELEATAESPDLFNSIASQYHNVFLSRHFLGLMRARVEACEAGEDAEVSPATPVVLARMVNFAEQLVLQLQEMSQLYEMQQLDKIKAICAVAQEDMAKLSEYVAGRKQELDEDFVKYLHYLMEAEKARLKGAGVARPEREPSNWLMILEIVKKGVYHELAKTVKDDVSMVHFFTRFDEEGERDHLCRAHVARLMPSQIIPFKRVVTQMVDHFESRVNELTDAELDLAGRVLQIEDILEELHPDSSLLALLQTKEGGVGLDAYKTGADTLLHDPREWDDSALEGREDELFSPEYLAAKYDRILKHYGFTASRQEGRGMGNAGEEEKEDEEEKRKQLAGGGSGGALPAEVVGAAAVAGEEAEVEETGGAGSILEALREEGVL